MYNKLCFDDGSALIKAFTLVSALFCQAEWVRKKRLELKWISGDQPPRQSISQLG